MPLLVLPLVPEVPVPLVPDVPPMSVEPLLPEVPLVPEVPLEPVPDAPELFMPLVPLEPRQVSVPLSPRLPLPLVPDWLLPLLVELSVELEPEVPLAPEEVRSAALLDFFCFFFEVDCFCGSVLVSADWAATPALTSNAVRIKAILLFMGISFNEMPRQ